MCDHHNHAVSLSEALEAIGSPAGALGKTKKCSDCGEVKDVGEFSKHRGKKDGLQPICKPCQKVRRAAYIGNLAVREATLARGTKVCGTCKEELPLEQFASNKRSVDGFSSQCRACQQSYQQVHRYGITQAQKEDMLAAQGGVCGICGTSDPGTKGWVTDHCHSSGKVRQILCSDCNKGLGHGYDEPLAFMLAAEYLGNMEHQEVIREIQKNKKLYEQKYPMVNGIQTPEYKRNGNLMRNYHLSIDAYDAILEMQCHKCACCRSPEPNSKDGRFVVDHDHDTGAVRGLVCNSCNTLIGYAKDSPEILHKMLDAAEQHHADVMADLGGVVSPMARRYRAGRIEPKELKAILSAIQELAPEHPNLAHKVKTGVLTPKEARKATKALEVLEDLGVTA